MESKPIRIHRVWKSNAPDSKITVRLYSDKVILNDLLHYLYENGDPYLNSVSINFTSIEWEDDPTAEELQKREEFRQKRLSKTEQWERDIYARLKAKFEPEAELGKHNKPDEDDEDKDNKNGENGNGDDEPDGPVLRTGPGGLTQG